MEDYMIRGALLMLLLAAVTASADDFDLSKHSIPLEKIQGGGPPKDGIPSLTDPEFIEAGQAKYLKEEDRVLGVYRNGIAKAYPIRILTWHEAVNDLFQKEPVAVTY